MILRNADISGMLTIALGANLGDRHATLSRARHLITERIGPLIAASSVVETKAWGKVDQPDFLNQVISVDPRHFAPQYFMLGAAAGAKSGSIKAYLHKLLDSTQAIEAELGRQREITWGPRTCDIDLIFVGDLRYEDERLSLPHPWWRERDFVGGIIERELAEFLLPLH
ncbi:MAG: 2-amino-4-hydroxy-6-hydroxymethyldihydropteridine diphosphokinase [Bacteroidota bacterium]